MRVDYIQGFFFAKPMPINELDEFYKNFYYDSFLKEERS